MTKKKKELKPGQALCVCAGCKKKITINHDDYEVFGLPVCDNCNIVMEVEDYNMG